MAQDRHDGVPPAVEGPRVERGQLDHLMPLVYEELRALAGMLLRDKAAGVTLQPTSLVHEAYLRLLDQRRMDWQDRLHIEGRRITVYAREKNLGVEARLRLFVKVCSAVQFAHQNLIVHRDLKPGNLLVDRDGRAAGTCHPGEL